MNPNEGQQGASNQQQNQNLPLDQQPQFKGLVKPAQIQNFNFLAPKQKQQYQNGIASLWQALHQNPQDSQAHKTAHTKLLQISRTLFNDLRKHQSGQTGAAQPGQPGQPGQQSQQSQQSQASLSRPASQGQPQSQPQQPQQPTAAPQQQVQQPQPQQQQQQQPGPQQGAEIPEAYSRRVESMSFVLPPNQTENYLTELKKRYAAALFKKDTHQSMLQKIAAQEQQLQQAGQQLPAPMAQTKAKNQAALQHAMQFINEVNNQQRNLGAGNAGAQRAANGQPGTSSATQQQAQQQAAGQQQRPQGITGQQNNASQANPAATAGGAAGQQQNSQARPQQPGQGQMNQAQNFNAPRPGLAGPPFPAGQTQSPQTTMPSQGPPVPYSHQGAISAARSYSNPQISQPNGTTNGQNAFQRADERQTKPTYGGMRNWTPPAPQPVPMGATRPTLTGSSSGLPGMMGQPAISQKPEFSLHGQGDRVMDKKKLDELVRQVAGAGNGAEQQSLQPDVEESMLGLADEFVDNVITQACKLAKARQSSQLELRDLQVVLERQYNIRIPGYALDDNRTVRKMQPAPGYLQKMNAVQAAKVMGGKTDI